MQNINALERCIADNPAILIELLADPVAGLRLMGVELSNDRALEIVKAMSLANRLFRPQDVEELAVAVSAV